MKTGREQMETYLAIKHVFIALTTHGKLNVGGITGCNIRLSHKECGADLPLQEWCEPPLLLGVVAILCQHLHVASIGSSIVGCLHQLSAIVRAIQKGIY